MPDRPELPDTATLDAIEDAQIDLGTVTAYRVLVLGPGQDRATATDFVRENTLGARWIPSGVAAIYSSLERETAGAEGAHLMAVNNPTGRFQLGELSLHLERVVDLRSEERLAHLQVGCGITSAAATTRPADSWVQPARGWACRACSYPRRGAGRRRTW